MNIKVLAVLSVAALLSFGVNGSVARAYTGVTPQVQSSAPETEIVGISCEERYDACLGNCDSTAEGGKDANCTCECENAACYCQIEFYHTHFCLPMECD
jgi:hypothetical protein